MINPELKNTHTNQRHIMLKINFYDLNTIANEQLKYAVIVARHSGKWIFVKHKERATWEIPGGHREEGENILDAASRELNEETGAKDFSTIPVCIYSVSNGEVETFGQLFYATVESIDSLPDFEIGEIMFSDTLPKDLTYPLIQPYLFKKVEEFCFKTSKI
jgi:8-oxo-dGTP diphosphatase